MLIGLIESLKVKDSEPLRNEIVIRPRHLLSNLDSVVLIVEQEPDIGQGARGSSVEGGGS